MRQKFGDTSSDTVRHWLTEKRAENVAVAYRRKFGAKKRLFKDQELVVSQINTYLIYTISCARRSMYMEAV